MCISITTSTKFSRRFAVQFVNFGGRNKMFAVQLVGGMTIVKDTCNVYCRYSSRRKHVNVRTCNTLMLIRIAMHLFLNPATFGRWATWLAPCRLEIKIEWRQSAQSTTATTVPVRSWCSRWQIKRQLHGGRCVDLVLMFPFEQSAVFDDSVHNVIQKRSTKLLLFVELLRLRPFVVVVIPYRGYFITVPIEFNQSHSSEHSLREKLLLWSTEIACAVVRLDPCCKHPAYKLVQLVDLDMVANDSLQSINLRSPFSVGFPPLRSISSVIAEPFDVVEKLEKLVIQLLSSLVAVLRMVIEVILHLLNDIDDIATRIFPAFRFQEIVLERNEPTNHGKSVLSVEPS